MNTFVCVSGAAGISAPLSILANRSIDGPKLIALQFSAYAENCNVDSLEEKGMHSPVHFPICKMGVTQPSQGIMEASKDDQGDTLVTVHS